MAYQNQFAVIGCAIDVPAQSGGKSLEEQLYAITQAVLADAGIEIEDIDGIVVASNDQFDGRAISVMMASGSVGGVDRDILSTPSAGEHAFVMGALRVASGQYRTQLVLSWSPLEASSLSEAQRLGADPYFHRRLPLDELSSHALQASALINRVPVAATLAATIAEKNRKNGARAYPDAAAGADKAPARWPLTAETAAAATDGLVALVLASADFVEEKKIEGLAWIRGMGWTTEPGFLGDRDLATAPALVAAAKRAYAEAGIDDPQTAFDVAEVSDMTPYQELLAYEGLGLASSDRWEELTGSGAFGPEGSLPVNLSGGALSANPVYCTGLVRIAEAANQVRGRAGRHQAPEVRTALAHAASGFAMQYQTVVVLGGEKEVAQ